MAANSKSSPVARLVQPRGNGKDRKERPLVAEDAACLIEREPGLIPIGGDAVVEADVPAEQGVVPQPESRARHRRAAELALGQ